MLYSRYFIYLCFVANSFANFALFGASNMPNIDNTVSYTPLEKTISMQTGHLLLQKQDVVIRCKEPILLKRFYSSEDRRKKEGGWKFFPETQMTMYKKGFWEKLFKKNKADKFDYLLKLYLENGQKLILKGIEHKDTQTVFFQGHKPDRTLFLDSSSINNSSLKAEVNLKENYLILFETSNRKKLYRLHENIKNKKQQFFLEAACKPNGCKIVYSWDKSNRLEEIKSLSPTGKSIYGWAKFYYNGSGDGKHNFQIKTSDGRSLQYSFTRIQRKKEQKESHYLKTVSSSFSPTEYYEYQSRYNKRGPSLEAVRLPLGKLFEVEYYHEKLDETKNLVHFLKAPAQESSSNNVLYGYYYKIEAENELKEKKQDDDDENQTLQIVSSSKIDQEGNIVRYIFNKKTSLIKEIEYLTSIEPHLFDFGHKKLVKYFSQRFYFDELGRLISKGTFNAEGKLKLLKHFTYDISGNVIKESIYGDLTGEKELVLSVNEKGQPQGDLSQVYSKYYRYSQDGLNLLLEEKEDSGLTFEYQYKPTTDLLTFKLTKDQEQILKRQFFEYSHENVLIKEINDDGCTKDPDNLLGAMERKIKYITLSQEKNTLDLPAAIEEKYFNFETGKEEQLKKTVLNYSVKGLLVKEEIFNSQNQFCYCLDYAYNDQEQLISEKDASKNLFQYSYDANFNLIKKQTEDAVKYLIYDNLNRLTKKTVKFKKLPEEISRFKYDYKSNLIEKTDFQNQKTVFKYDPFGRCQETILPAVLNENKINVTPVLKTKYDLFGNAEEKIDSLKKTTRTYYTVYKKPHTIILPGGGKKIFTYYKNGNLKSRLLENGSKELFYYDILNNLTLKQTLSKNSSLLKEEKWSYKAEKLIKHTQKNGLSTFYWYDGAGRKIKEAENKEKVIFYEYDNLGFETAKISHLNQSQALKEIFQKDVFGRTLEIRKENLKKELFYKKSFEFDAAGNLQAEITYNQAGQAAELFYYDAKKRLVKQINALGHITSINYNDFYTEDNKTYLLQKTTYDPEGNTAIETFDALNRLKTFEKRTAQNETCLQNHYYYDAAGNRTFLEETVFENQIASFKKNTKWQFTDEGRLKKAVLAESSPSEKSFQLGYDEAGLKTRLETVSKALFYEHNENGQLTSIKSKDGSLHLTYQYDEAGHLVSAEDVLQKITLKRKYNLFGHLLEESVNDIKIKREQDLFGRITALYLPDLSSVEYSYNEAALKEVVRFNAQKQKTFAYKYQKFDLAGNPIQTEIENLSPINYKIDKLNRTFFVSSRFFQQTIDSFSPSGSVLSLKTYAFPDNFYTYSALGQLKTETGVFENNFIFDSNYHLKQKNGQTFQISEASELFSELIYSPEGLPIFSKEKKEVYSYDCLNRLTGFENSQMKVVYTYDPLGRRFSKTVFNKIADPHKENCFQTDEGKTFYFLNLDDIEIGSVDAQGKIKDLKILGLAPQKELGAVIAVEIDGIAYASLSDLRGSVAALIDFKTKTLKESYLYSAFGEKRIYSSRREEIKTSSFKNPFTFQSKREEENGLIFFGQRYFDPKLGLFLTPDNTDFLESTNPYAYVKNSPLNYADPSGLSSQKAFFYNHFGSFGESLKTIGSFFSLPIKFTGLGLEFLSEHCIPVPILQDAIYIGGRFLQFDFTPDDIPSLRQPSTAVYGDFNPQSNVIYINGILNTRPDAGKSAQIIADLTQGQGQTALFHNPTRGFLRDLIECFQLSLGVQTASSRGLNAFLKDYLNNMDSDGKLLVVAHSGGALELENALKGLTAQEKSMLQIRTFAPAATISDQRVSSAVNYTSTKDFISFLSPHTANTVYLPSKGIPLTDHAFSNATYQTSVHSEIDNFFHNTGFPGFL